MRRYIHIYNENEKKELDEKIKQYLKQPIPKQHIKVFYEEPTSNWHNIQAKLKANFGEFDQILGGFSRVSFYQLKNQMKYLLNSNLLKFLSKNYLPWKYYPFKNKEKTLKQLDNFVLDDFNNEDLWLKKDDGSFIPSLLMINVLSNFLHNLQKQLDIEYQDPITWLINYYKDHIQDYLQTITNGKIEPDDIQRIQVSNAKIDEFYEALELTKNSMLFLEEKMLNIIDSLKEIYKIKDYLSVNDVVIADLNFEAKSIDDFFKQCDAFFDIYNDFKNKNKIYNDKLNDFIDQNGIKEDVLDDNDNDDDDDNNDKDDKFFIKRKLSKIDINYLSDVRTVHNYNTINLLAINECYNLYNPIDLKAIAKNIYAFFDNLQKNNKITDDPDNVGMFGEVEDYDGSSDYLMHRASNFYYESIDDFCLTLEENLSLLVSIPSNFKLLASLLDEWFNSIHNALNLSIKNKDYDVISKLVFYLTDCAFDFEDIKDTYLSKSDLKARFNDSKKQLEIKNQNVEQFSLSFVEPWYIIVNSILYDFSDRDLLKFYDNDLVKTKNNAFLINNYYLAHYLYKTKNNDDIKYDIITQESLLNIESAILKKYLRNVDKRRQTAASKKEDIVQTELNSFNSNNNQNSLVNFKKPFLKSLGDALKFLKNIYGGKFNLNDPIFIYDTQNENYFNLKDVNDDVLKDAISDFLNWYKANMISTFITKDIYFALECNSKVLKDGILLEKETGKKLRR